MENTATRLAIKKTSSAFSQSKHNSHTTLSRAGQFLEWTLKNSEMSQRLCKVLRIISTYHLRLWMSLLARIMVRSDLLKKYFSRRDQISKIEGSFFFNICGRSENVSLTKHIQRRKRIMLTKKN